MYEPRSLDEMIGQKRILNQVRVSLQSALIREKPFPHTLLSGPGGTGKTTLARLIAKAMGHKLILKMPATLKSSVDVWNMFNDVIVDWSPLVFFLDEVHRLDVAMEEELYLPMENGIFVRKSGEKLLRGTYQLPPFTLIGATTNPGKLTEPFRSRFGLLLQVEPYSREEMETIIRQAAAKQDIPIEEEALLQIAARSRSSPRMANHLLDRCSDVAVTKGMDSVTMKIVEEAFELLGIDSFALYENDRKYLKAIYQASRPIGLSSLEPVLHLDKESITRHIEPFLVESGYITLTSRGRELTRKGIDLVESSVGLKGES